MTRAGTSTRAFAVALLAALAAGALPAVAASTTAASPLPGTGSHRAGDAGAPAGARLVACRRSPLLDERTAVVGAVMHPIAGATKLALRIDLYQRSIGSARWMLRSDVPGLGSWTSPTDPSVGSRPADVFKYRQAVARLVVPYAYRFHVGFRWLAASGAVVRESGTTTGTCREPDLRPDLVLSDLSVVPTSREGIARYTVVVRNVGRSPVRGVVVGATFASSGGTASGGAGGVGRLAPGAAAAVTFAGPSCAAGATPPTFLADPANTVDEARETNNELTGTCPAP